MPETPDETFFVNANVFYQMSAVDGAGSTAAFKDNFRRKLTGYDLVRFEKWHRQKRDLLNPGYASRINFQRINPVTINYIFVVLKLESI